MEGVNDSAARQRMTSPSGGTSSTHRPLPPPRAASPLEELEQQRHPFSGIKQWIQENQTLAVLGGFALGLLMGVLMRD